jgi:RNA-directed DNA polymerase
MAATARAGKLDTTSVNGPHGDDLGGDLHWDDVPWSSLEDDVRRLRQRIFKASQAGDLKRVRNLQKCLVPGLMESIKPRRTNEHGGITEVPRRAA